MDKNTTVVFPAPLMTTIAELGFFLAREKAAATPAIPAAEPAKMVSKPIADGAVTAQQVTATNGVAAGV